MNPGFYETSSRHDTLFVSPTEYNMPVFDFTQASKLNQEYKNAYNYSFDPRTGKSWSKENNEIFKMDWGLGRALYDLILVLPGIK